MRDFHVFEVELEGGFILCRLERVSATDAQAAMSIVAASHRFSVKKVLWAVDEEKLHWRDPEPTQRPAPQPLLPDPPLPEGVLHSHELAYPGYGVWRVERKDGLALRSIERANSATPALAIEHVAHEHGLDSSAELAAFKDADGIRREVLAYDDLELAQDYAALLEYAGVQGSQLWDHYEDSATYRHWRDYLNEQAAIDGFKLEHTHWLQTSFAEPISFIARPDGRPYKLPPDPKKRTKAVERDYGRELVQAARRRATLLARQAEA